MFYRTVRALENNLNVIYDATNVNRKLRINTLNRLKQAVSKPFITEAIVVYTDIAEVKRRNASRDRVVPEYAIDTVLKNFELPTYNEGWNFIGVHYSTEPNLNWLNAVNYYAKDLAHDNPHHILDVDAHMRAAHQYLLEYKLYIYPVRIHQKLHLKQDKHQHLHVDKNELLQLFLLFY